MPDGPRILDELRDAFQDGVDDLEQAGAERLDEWAQQGQDDLERLRTGIERHRGRRHEGGRRRRRGRRRRSADPAELEHRRRVRRARRRANVRLAFLTHLGTFAATLAILLVATRSIRIVMIVGLAWGIGVFIHYLWAIAAPRLRRRWVEDEVGVRSPPAVASERKRVGTRSRRSMEDLSASIAHEIRNPITAAKSLVQQMGEDPASAENLEYAELALSELDRVERSISHLLRYARDEEPRLRPTRLHALARAAVDGLGDRAARAGVELDLDFDGEGSMQGDSEKLRRVIENLVGNAIDAVAQSDARDPRVRVLGGESLAGDELWLRVIDNGPGVAEADRERIWSPFYTTKQSGTGLGLALTRKTIEAHGGRIELVCEPNRSGTEFVIAFPRDPVGGAGRHARGGDR